MNIALLIFAITIATSVVGLWWKPQVIDRCVFRPYWLVRRAEYHTLVTSGLVHKDFGHLLFNMLSYGFFAFQLQRVIGPLAFLLFYVGSLVLSEVPSWYKHRNDPSYGSLGASGAISAVLFASIVYFPDQELMILPFPVPIPAPLFAVSYVAYSWWSARQSRDGINHDAHLAGALLGLLFVLVYEPSAYAALFGLLRGS
jgi:membrane associated rhomboid family serine protease